MAAVSARYADLLHAVEAQVQGMISDLNEHEWVDNGLTLHGRVALLANNVDTLRAWTRDDRNDA